MHMRMSSDDVVEKLLRILTEHAAKDAEMRLAASLILHALASDHANLEYFDGSAVAFLARLAQAGTQDAAVMALGSAAAAASSPKRAGVFSRGRGLPKIRMGNRMADGKSRKKEVTAESILPLLSELLGDEQSPGEQPSAAAFALKTLEVLSDQHQLKDEFRASGLLDYLAGVVCNDARQLHAVYGGLRNPDAAVVIRSMMPCLHILEKVTFLNEANATYLVNTSPCAEVVKALLNALAVCDGADISVKIEAGDGGGTRDARSNTDTDSHDELTSRVIMSVCLRVLVNLTNDQPVGCALVASNSAVDDAGHVQAATASSSNGERCDNGVRIKQEGDKNGKGKQGEVSTSVVAVGDTGGKSSAATDSHGDGLLCVMRAVVTALAYQWHDSLIVALALVVNLLEQNDECCKQLENLELRPSLKVETTSRAQARAGKKAKTTYQKLSIGTAENLLPTPMPALSFFCDLYVCTNGVPASGANETEAAAMPESQLLDGGSDDEDDGDGNSSLGIVSGYSAVLLGFLCLRRQATSCASRVRSRLAAADNGCPPFTSEAEAAGKAGHGIGLEALIESVRSFGVVHAEAGVLHEAQARLFDEMIACLTKELEDGQAQRQDT
eukprot:COSAG02_NODE_3285_length_7007_cov_4.103503_3_plen_613_part_00